MSVSDNARACTRRVTLLKANSSVRACPRRVRPVLDLSETSASAIVESLAKMSNQSISTVLI
ncbi:MAG: hypothetical protein RR844_05355 [Clostridium sp.]